MNRRLKTLIASVCVAASLISSTAVSAFAEDIKYTLKSGDTVLSVCQSLGIDFYKNKDWITKKNNIKDYSKLKVGTVIILPGNGSNTSASTTPSITGGVAAEGSAGDKSLKGEDFISGYLISHTLVSGETVGGVCQSLGIDFESNSETIKKLNNITSYNRVAAGKVLLLPSTKAPTSGAYVKIVAHKIVSGDTAYGICQSYGISYDGNLTMLKNLNNKDDFSAIKAGQIMYLPVPGGTAAGGTGGSTNTPATAVRALHKIYMDASYGAAQLQVNGVTVTNARTGDTITVVTKPDEGYAFSFILVQKADDNKVEVEVKDNTFVMPDYDVTVTAVCEWKSAQ